MEALTNEIANFIISFEHTAQDASVRICKQEPPCKNCVGVPPGSVCSVCKKTKQQHAMTNDLGLLHAYPGAIIMSDGFSDGTRNPEGSPMDGNLHFGGEIIQDTWIGFDDPSPSPIFNIHHMNGEAGFPQHKVRPCEGCMKIRVGNRCPFCRKIREY